MGNTTKIYKALGLMSGTSIDGIDVALIETDGINHAKPLGFMAFPYEYSFKAQLRTCFGCKEGATDPRVRDVERTLTEEHARAVKEFLCQKKLDIASIDLIGFHGQTLWHNPAARETVQLGDGALLAKLTGIAVVNDFRTADVRAGGQGAPLVPLYHRALAAALPKPVALINIGGVSNITWIGGETDEDLLAFDLGPGNALLDDWMMRHTGQPCDLDGACAQAGCIDEAFVTRFLNHPYFRKTPPKSLDRDAFAAFVPEEGMRVEDGAATLTMMTVQAIAHGLTQTRARPENIYITGGGRCNKVMMRWLAAMTQAAIQKVDAQGWNGDAMEAEAFAYLAVRSVLGLPLSVPQTTSVPEPMTGGTLNQP